MIVAVEAGGLQLFNITSVENVTSVSNISGSGIWIFLKEKDDYIFVSDYKNNLEIISIADITNPVHVKTLEKEAGDTNSAIVIEVGGPNDKYLFSGGEDYIDYIDITDPSNPFIQFTHPIIGFVHETPQITCMDTYKNNVIWGEFGGFYMYEYGSFKLHGIPYDHQTHCTETFNVSVIVTSKNSGTKYNTTIQFSIDPASLGDYTFSSDDTCVCPGGQFGYLCQIVDTECFGIDKSLTESVCSGHGVCHGNDTCVCDSFYIGVNCEVERSGVGDHIFFTIVNNTSTTNSDGYRCVSENPVGEERFVYTTGYTEQYSSTLDIVVTKYTADGEIVSNMVAINDSVEALSNFHVLTPDGIYMIVAASTTYPDDRGVLVKYSTDDSWTKIWGKLFQCPISITEGIHLQQPILEEDGSILIMGNSFCPLMNIRNSIKNPFFLRIDSNADEITMSRTFGLENSDIGLASYFETSDGDIVVVSISGDHPLMVGTVDSQVYKLDRDGNLVWARNVGGPGCTTYFFGGVETKDHDYVFSGFTDCTDDEATDVLLVKVSYYGDLIWTEIIRSESNNTSDAMYSSIITNVDDDLIISGWKDYGGTTRSFVAKINHHDGGSMIFHTVLDQTYSTTKMRESLDRRSYLIVGFGVLGQTHMNGFTARIDYDGYNCMNLDSSQYEDFYVVFDAFPFQIVSLDDDLLFSDYLPEINDLVETSFELVDVTNLTYPFSYCSGYECFGESDYSSVCSGHGSCIPPSENLPLYDNIPPVDNCVCYDSYYGETCSIPSCNGILSNETEEICSGHGECLSFDNCTCYSNYYGEFCNLEHVFEYVRGHLSGSKEGGVYNSDISECINNNNTFSPGGRSRSGTALFGSSGAEKMYLFGGLGLGEVDDSPGHLSDLWSFDFAEGNWCFLKGNKYVDVVNSSFSEVDPFVFDNNNYPGGRSSYASFYTTFSFFVFGGQISGSSLNDVFMTSDTIQTNELWELSTIGDNKNKWRLMYSELDDNNSPTQPSKRASHCASKRYFGKISNLEDEVYIFGGGAFLLNTSSVLFNDFWKYDISTSTFSRVYELNNFTNFPNLEWNETEFFEGVEKGVSYGTNFTPPPRYSHLCWVSVDYHFYVFGGIYQNLNPSNDVFMFNLTQNQWSWVSGGGDETETEIADGNDYNVGNIPERRSFAIGFSNQDVLEDNWVLVFGGLNKNYDRTLSDIWSFSNSLNQFMLVNGSSLEYNLESTSDRIGCRFGGVGLMIDRVFVIFGGQN